MVQLTVMPFVTVAVAATAWLRWNTARSQPSYAAD